MTLHCSTRSEKNFRNTLLPDRRSIPLRDEEHTYPGFSEDGGHGTIVGGTTQAARDNGGVFCGLLPEAKRRAVKFIDADTPPTASNAALAIRYAIEQGAKVINASWHVSLDQKALRDAI